MADPQSNAAHQAHLAQVHYGGHQVTDPHMRDIVQRIADYLGRDIRIVGGDRDWITNKQNGGSPTSLHLDTRGGRAVDIHMADKKAMPDREAFEAIKAVANEIFDRDKAYELVYHPPGSGKPEHVHIGHYPDTFEKGYVSFRVERPLEQQTPTHRYDSQKFFLDGPTLAREAPAQSLHDIRQELIEKYKNLPPPTLEQERIPVMELER